MLRIKRILISSFLLVLLLTTAASAKAKNVIIMIADGWCYNHALSTQYYTGKEPVYKSFPVQLPCSTFSDSTRRHAVAGTKPGYDPSAAWISDGVGGLKPNVKYVAAVATDSAAAATALATGVKTHDGYLGMGPDKKRLVSIGEIAKQYGKAAGSISSVHFSNATPAAFGSAHNLSRGAYLEIAKEMVESNFDVIMGPGHPFFDNNNEPAKKANYSMVGEEVWNKLVKGQYPNTKLIETKKQFERLATASNPRGRYIGVPQVISTLQQARSAGDPQSVHLETFNKNVPTLAAMSRAALNVLSQNKNGFVLMIEGGAVDWANHGNQKGRAIEEMIGFNDAVEAVTKWVEKNGGWKDNLVLVTGDHDSGLILGPNGETDVIDMGVGNIPGMKFNTGGHANMLLPVYANGDGSELLYHYLSSESDPVRGKWVDNTDLFRLMRLHIMD